MNESSLNKNNKKLKIIAPIKKEGLVDRFIDAGADELYGSCVLSAWQEKYGTQIEYNRRGNYGDRANCENEESFFKLVTKSAKRYTPFYLTVNALKISEQQADDLLPLLKNFKEAGGYGVIISDLSMIERIKFYDLAIVASSCMEVNNSLSAQFYRDLGCERIILPRNLTISEMESITQKVPDVEYEVFYMNSGCRFTDGNCLGIHASAYGELCRYCDNNTEFFYKKSMNGISVVKDEKLYNSEIKFSKLLRKACSICSIYDLSRFANSLKIVERVADEKKILSQIELAQKNIDIALQCDSTESYLEKVQYPEDTEKRCNYFYNCYYRTDMLSFFLKQTSFFKKGLDRYKDSLENRYSKEYVDYLGVNISSPYDNIYQYKIYYTSKASSHLQHEIVDYLNRQEMIRHITCIDDSEVKNQFRVDIGLKNRNVSNIKTLFDLIDEKTGYFEQNKSLILDLSKMQITHDISYSYASMYFWGFIERQGVISSLKFHFLNRQCDNPDIIGKNFHYNDQYYLDYINNIDVPYFKNVLALVRFILNNTEGHLWMTGVDCEITGNDKYKIYVKSSTTNTFTHLINYCKKNRLWSGLVVRLISISKWYSTQNELVLDGFAACENVEGTKSINFYFKMF